MKKKTKKSEPAKRELIEVPAGEVCFDPKFNSRKSMLERTEPTARDLELEASMRARIALGRSPNHTPVKLRLNADKKTYTLTFGFRRLAAALRIGPDTVILGIDEGDAKNDTSSYRDRIDNLSENLQRVQLLPYELGETFAEIRKEYPDISATQIALDVGFDKTYVNALLRLRSKLAEDLWDAYKINAAKMSVQELLEVAKLPKDEQVAAWSARAEEKRGGRPKGAETGSKTPRIGKMADEKNLKLWLKKTRKARTEQTGSIVFLDGVERALQSALGMRSFSLEEVE